MGGVGVAVREPLARLFTVDEDTVRALGPFMLCLSLAQPAMQLHFTLAGAFRGAGDTVTPLYASFVGNWLFRVPLASAACNFCPKFLPEPSPLTSENTR
jgi:Na+-driven multidrug efflux pump